MTKYNHRYYFYSPRKTDIHKTKCDQCGIWAQNKAIFKIPNDFQHKPYHKGDNICLECYFK